MKRQKSHSGLERERRRRESDENRKRVQAAVVDGVAEVSPVAPPAPQWRAGASVSVQQPDTASCSNEEALVGRRSQQLVSCGWCGGLIEVKAVGRLPTWCSARCRRRAWERKRVAPYVPAVVKVLGSEDVVPPVDTDGWLELIKVLEGQVRRGQLDSRMICGALARVEAASAHDRRPPSAGEGT